MVAAGNGAQVMQVIFSSFGLFIGLSAALIVGIVVYRGRRRPGSRMRAVIDAGFVAIPGVVAVIAGLVGIFVGIAYFVVLFFYWLFYLVIATIWVSIVGGRVTYPVEFGQIAGQGLIYIGLGLLVAMVGSVWLVLVITRAIRAAQRRLQGNIYTNAPPGDPAAALAPPAMAAGKTPAPGKPAPRSGTGRPAD